MSSYTGELAGTMYGEQLRKERESKMAAEEADFARRQQADRAWQGEMNLRQQALAMQAPAYKPFENWDKPAWDEDKPKALPNPASAGRSSEPDLASYMRHVSLGNPQAAEKYMGGMVRSGSTVHDKENDTIKFISNEGHEVTIPNASSYIGGSKPMSEKDKKSMALKEADDKRKQAKATSQAIKVLEAHDSVVAGAESELAQAQAELKKARESIGIVESGKNVVKGFTGAGSKVTQLPDDHPNVAPKAKAVKDLEEKINQLKGNRAALIMEFSQAGIDIDDTPKKTAVPATPPPEKKPSGKGKMSMVDKDGNPIGETAMIGGEYVEDPSKIGNNLKGKTEDAWKTQTQTQNDYYKKNNYKQMEFTDKAGKKTVRWVSPSEFDRFKTLGRVL